MGNIDILENKLRDTGLTDKEATDILQTVKDCGIENYDLDLIGKVFEEQLTPTTRSALGAHYTPRSQSDILIHKTVIEPLESDWCGLTHNIQSIEEFHDKLLAIKVLDPACGSANLLYATFDLLKKLEAKVLDAYTALGGDASIRDRVHATQMRGIEKNPVACKLAKIVLWLCHIKYGGSHYPDSDHILCGDSLITEGLLTTKTEWPDADYIVGNPPFIGNSKKRKLLGDDYVDTINKLYDGLGGSDLVMHWWDRCAELVKQGKVRRFGLITTNTITGRSNRKIVGKYVKSKHNPLTIVFATKRQPWAGEGTTISIAMTVCSLEQTQGQLLEDGQITVGDINTDLTIGIDLTDVKPIKTHHTVAGVTPKDIVRCGAQLCGRGFLVTKEQADTLSNGCTETLSRIKPFISAADINKKSRGLYAIDLNGLSETQAMTKFPSLYNYLKEHVKPERDLNRSKSTRENWWIFGQPKEKIRSILSRLDRYIAVSGCCSQLFFQFVEDPQGIPDHGLVCIALSDYYSLGILSSKVHTMWAHAFGGTSTLGFRYGSKCFTTFAFPENLDSALIDKISRCAEELDKHRDYVRESVGLTMTQQYAALNRDTQASVKDTHTQTLQSIHARLDKLVYEAYGWPECISDSEVLQNLKDLNTTITCATS